MSIISIPYTFSAGTTIVSSQVNQNFSTIYTDYNGNIGNNNLSSSVVISDTKLAQIVDASKVSGSALTSLGSIPSGAGTIPIANLPALVPNYIKCSYVQSAGVNGGTATSGSWQVYPLNTKDTDTGSIGTLSGNQLTIPAGIYTVKASVVFRRTASSQIQLYNVTGSAILLIGQTVSADSSGAGTAESSLLGQITLSGPTAIEIQYQVGATASSTGLGLAGGFGSEVYGFIEIVQNLP